MDFTEQIDLDTSLLLQWQHEGGGFPASPGFSQYPYSWLRDGSFIAWALDTAGEQQAAAHFHAWAARTLLQHEATIRKLLSRRASGEPVPGDSLLPARFTLTGEWLEDGWPNFQMDGYGQWLWSLGEHVRAGGDAPPQGAVALAADYVAAFWNEPCYDAWEEHRTQLHTSTLISCWAGLTAAARILGRQDLAATAEEVRAYVLENCVLTRSLIKYVRNTAVDSSLLWAIEPLDFLAPDHPLAAGTLDRVRGELMDGDAVIRYRADTYYGGGGWVLLTAWLGLAELRMGRPAAAQNSWEWVQNQRNAAGHLPEQVPVPGSDRWFLDWWRNNWGESASPLLWSHAMSLVLGLRLREAGR